MKEKLWEGRVVFCVLVFLEEGELKNDFFDYWVVFLRCGCFRDFLRVGRGKKKGVGFVVW